MKKLVVNLETGETTEVELNATEISQKQKDKVKYLVKKAKRKILKGKKNAYLATLNAEQEEGFRAIIKDGNFG